MERGLGQVEQVVVRQVEHLQQRQLAERSLLHAREEVEAQVDTPGDKVSSFYIKML